MSELSRISKTFYKHPKAQRARSIEPGSISLWLFGNCWCRNHRAQGFIPRDKALELGTEAEIKALVTSRLWREVDGGYQYWDWTEWNPDMVRNGTRSSAGWIVWNTLADHPEVTRTRLAGEVEKLIEEGVCRSVIEQALQKWASRSDAKPTWLPYFVSDVLRESNSGVHAAIREARKTWDMSVLSEHGFKWLSPDLPDGMKSAKQVREYMRARKAEWLDQIEAELSSESNTG